MGDGVVAIVCGRRESRKRCSCGELTDLLCDYPIGERGNPKPPKVGDARTNIYNRKVFYVWHVVNAGDEDFEKAPAGYVLASDPSVPTITGARVVVSTKQPSFAATPPGALVMTWAAWFDRTRPACDRPVCRRCVVKLGTLDICAAHGRELAKASK